GASAIDSWPSPASNARHDVTALILLVLALQSPAGARDVHGVVVDVSGAPVRGAAVRLTADGRPIAETVSRPDGTFVFDAAPDTTLTLTASAPGFADRSIRFDGGPAQQARIVLEPRGISETVNVSAIPERHRVATPVSATILDAQSLAE